PKTSVFPRTPKSNGLPGLTATPQKTSSTPSSERMPRTRSCGPTETPPEVTKTSAASPRSSALRWDASSSATAGSCSTSAPAATNVVPLVNRLWDLDFVVPLDNTLDRDDGIGAVRHDTSGRDRHRLDSPQGTSSGYARHDPSDDGEPAGRISRTDRETVHRRA